MVTGHALWRTGHGFGLAAGAFGCWMLVTAGALAQPETPAEHQPEVEILRGSVAPPAPPVEPAAAQPTRLAVAGERLWLVDEARGRLTGCRLINTLQVGGQAIRCTERPLPKGKTLRE